MPTIEDLLSRPGGLAERLRALRRERGLTGTSLANALGWPQSKISKIETGKQMPTDTDVADWARACRAGRGLASGMQALLAEAQSVHREWRQQIRLGLAPIQRTYDDLARHASVIRNFEVTFVPGLLQTAEYARHRALESVRLHDGTPDDVDAATAQRMKRQEVLYDTSKRFEFVITEAALRFLLCPRDAMLAQLDRLLVVTGMPHIKFGIVPFGVELATAPQHGFILFDDLAAVETIAGEAIYHGQEATVYADVMANLARDAVHGRDANRLITAVLGDHGTSTRQRQ